MSLTGSGIGNTENVIHWIWDWENNSVTYRAWDWTPLKYHLLGLGLEIIQINIRDVTMPVQQRKRNRRLQNFTVDAERLRASHVEGWGGAKKQFEKFRFPCIAIYLELAKLCSMVTGRGVSQLAASSQQASQQAASQPASQPQQASQPASIS